jgi:pimeloyl-ACP methyl ester carboxylesterase
MQKGIPQTHVQRFPKAGHFVMLEEPSEFSQKLKSFLDEPLAPAPP